MSTRRLTKTSFSSQLNFDCHRFVTDICHRYSVVLTPRQLQFVEVGYDKIQLLGKPFCRNDFPYLTRNNFSQIIHRINKILPLIEKVIDGYPPFFTLNGLYLDKNVIKKPTGVNDSFINQKIETLLSLTKNQQPSLHDIRLSSKTSQLYEKLQEKGLSTTMGNKQFLIPILTDNSRFNTKAQINPNGRMDVMIGCSQLPVSVTLEGFSDLTEHIAEVKYYLKLITNAPFLSEPAYNWIFGYYHFNRDSEPITDPAYRFSLGQLSNYMYIKEFDNGVIKARVEEKRTQKTKLIDESKKLLKPTFQKAS